MKDLEKESLRPRRAISDLTLDKLILQGAAALQLDPPPQQPRLLTTGPGNGFSAIAAFRFRFASPPTGNGNAGNDAPTIKPDHSVGADQAQGIDFIPS